jgi:lysophospholipase L1-like esterase
MKAPVPAGHIARLAGIVSAILTLTACDAVNDAIDAVEDIGNDADVFYVVSTGDSLAVGIQPNSEGLLLPTDDGYPDQFFDIVRPDFESSAPNRELRLVKLGCPGETIDDMLNGGECLYVAGSQLEAAVDFLEDNREKVLLVTIDIGGNDFRNADCITAEVDFDCVNDVSGRIASDLASVLAALSAAASPATTIIGMNYYNPYLSSWLEGPRGQSLAMESAQAGVLFNDALATTYATAGIAMADVYAAFESDDFTTMVQSSLRPPNNVLPVSVANICSFTYMCDADPVGPDIHPNNAGYSLIAETMSQLSP